MHTETLTDQTFHAMHFQKQPTPKKGGRRGGGGGGGRKRRQRSGRATAVVGFVAVATAVCKEASSIIWLQGLHAVIRMAFGTQIRKIWLSPWTHRKYLEAGGHSGSGFITGLAGIVRTASS